MATTETSDAEGPLDELLVVDADVHCSSRGPVMGTRIAERMEMPYRDLLDPTTDTATGSPQTGHHGEIPGKIEALPRLVDDPRTDIEEPLCEDLGVDHPILNVVGRYDMLPDARQAIQQMRATNDVFVERFLDGNEDYFGLASIAMRRPDKAAEEIDRLGDEDQIVGVLIHPGGQNRGLGDPLYDPVYKAAEDNDLAVAFHTTFNGFMWQMPGIFQGMETNLELHALQHPWAMMWTVASLITNGTPVKFPDLNFVCLESGIGWIPYMMSRLNREYSSWRSQAPLLEQMPEEYIREHFYFSTQPLGEFNRPADIRNLIELLETDQLLFSSDHPHFDFDNPESIQGYFDHLSTDEQRMVFGENAIEAFDLPL